MKQLTYFVKVNYQSVKDTWLLTSPGDCCYCVPLPSSDLHRLLISNWTVGRSGNARDSSAIFMIFMHLPQYIAAPSHEEHGFHTRMCVVGLGPAQLSITFSTYYTASDRKLGGAREQGYSWSILRLLHKWSGKQMFIYFLRSNNVLSSGTCRMPYTMCLAAINWCY